MVLTRCFFDRPTLKVAEELLGKYLVRKWRGKIIAAMITEVEAYDGPYDRASHASRGKTERNKTMFGPAGHFYVYFTYGMHWLLNIVTDKDGYPAAVLIRGVEGMNGPARVTKFLHIDKKLNGKPADKKSGLWFENGPARRSPGGGGGVKFKIKKSPRIGIEYAGPTWAKKRFRFSLKSHS
jgi:DNA-3-methyladenine glycosylase